MSAPLVVVATPVYNGARYLAEALESVAAQTWPNLLHIVLDNASADATAAILARAQARDRRLRVRRNGETLPIMQNWSAAFALVPPEAAYVRILCADDRLAPDAIVRTVALARSDPAITVVLCGEETAAGLETWNWPSARSVFDGPAMAAALLRSEVGVTAPHALYRADLLARRRPFFDPSLICGDLDALLWAMRQGKVGYVHAPLAFTRDHAGSNSATVMRRDFLHYAEWLVCLARHGPGALSEAELQRLRRAFLRHYLRRMLRWGLTERRGALVREHLRRLERFALKPRAFDYLDAAIDWPLKELGLRPHWRGYPY